MRKKDEIKKSAAASDFDDVASRYVFHILENWGEETTIDNELDAVAAILKAADFRVRANIPTVIGGYFDPTSLKGPDATEAVHWLNDIYELYRHHGHSENSNRMEFGEAVEHIIKKLQERAVGRGSA